MMDTKLIKKFKTNSKDTNWELGNKILYNLCKEHPFHKNEDEIIAKLWLIGRSYSASIERRKTKTKDKMDTGQFYYDVAKTMKIWNKKYRFDEKLKKLNTLSEFDENSINEIIETHNLLMKFFNMVSKLNKRSLASKYLHFHCPIFPIYDSIANRNINLLNPEKRRFNGKGDEEYSKFCYKILQLKKEIKNEENYNPTTRQMDIFLLSIGD